MEFGSELPQVSVGVLSKACNIDPARIQQLAKQGILAKVRHGHYDLVANMAAYIRYLQGLVGGGDKDAHREKARLLAAQAEMAELNLAERREELVKVDDVRHLLTGIATSVRGVLIQLPTYCAPLIPSEWPIAKVEAVLRDKVDEALEAIRDTEIIQEDEELPK